MGAWKEVGWRGRFFGCARDHFRVLAVVVEDVAGVASHGICRPAPEGQHGSSERCGSCGAHVGGVAIVPRRYETNRRRWVSGTPPRLNYSCIQGSGLVYKGITTGRPWVQRQGALHPKAVGWGGWDGESR